MGERTVCAQLDVIIRDARKAAKQIAYVEMSTMMHGQLAAEIGIHDNVEATLRSYRFVEIRIAEYEGIVVTYEQEPSDG